MIEDAVKYRRHLSFVHELELVHFDVRSVIISKEELPLLRCLQLTRHGMEVIIEDMGILELEVDLVVLNSQSEVYFTELTIFLEKLIFNYNF